MSEIYYENLLNIESSGKYDWTSMVYHPYEATSYDALNLLFKNYKVDTNSFFIDFGSGKGRFSFYVNHFFNISVKGIEMDKDLYEKSLKNKSSYLNSRQLKNSNIEFDLGLAENLEIKNSYNKFYFFNPFSIEIFKKVIFNIIESIKTYPRDVDIILHYPIKEYVDYMDSIDTFVNYKDIKLPNFNEITDPGHFLYNRRKFLIYRFVN